MAGQRAPWAKVEFTKNNPLGKIVLLGWPVCLVILGVRMVSLRSGLRIYPESFYLGGYGGDFICYSDVGSATRPINKILPDRLSSMVNIKALSMVINSGMVSEVSEFTTAVAAAASVPVSSTFTHAS